MDTVMRSVGESEQYLANIKKKSKFYFCELASNEYIHEFNWTIQTIAHKYK